MRTKPLIILSFLGLTTAFAQAQTSDSIVSKPAISTPAQGDGPYMVVEQMPEYEGGQVELFNFIGKSLRYPIEAMQRGISGTVMVKFIVSKTGDVKEATILKSVCESLDKEALRVVNSMPKWKPGMQKGSPVDVWFTLPVRYKFLGVTKSNDYGDNYIGPTALQDLPLFIIDDKELTQEEFKAIPKDRIQSVSILKNETAKEKYGEKGKNGAVVITLKKQ